MNDAHTRASALNRFGLGARPGEPDTIDDPRAWLHGQLRARMPPAFAALPSSLVYLRMDAELLRELRSRRQAAGDRDVRARTADGMPAQARRAAMPGRQRLREAVARELDVRYRHAAATPHGFAERLVRFWSNHFAISADKRAAAPYAAPMEREAIRPHAFGRFADLLLAVERHPGMLRYLDNVRSIGEDSTLARRARRRDGGRKLGLNENLAREILELHTLGVDGGYTQDDVTELARAITGWGTPLPRDFEQGAASAFVFRAFAHEGGARRVLGRRYADAGVAQGEAILRDLAVHPATARHVSTKLAAHFIDDRPPPATVERMTRAWLDSGGDLPTVYRALIDSPEAWSSQARKFKTPDDYVLSALRAGGGELGVALLYPLLTLLGQPPFTPRSPAGFADDAASWNGADALYKRVQAAQRLGEQLPAERIDPVATARAALGPRLDADTLLAIRRAESPRVALAVLFASPAFQWRS